MGKKNDLIQLAGQVISKFIWPNADLKGRLWTPPELSRKSDYKGSNVSTLRDNSFVTISKEKYVDADGKNRERLIVHQFKKVESTKLGEEIIKLLTDAGLM